MKRTLIFVFLLTPFVVLGQPLGGAVSVNTNGVVSYPPNFWAANSNEVRSIAGVSLLVPNSRLVSGAGSITGGGTLASDLTLSLINDAASPGALRYYGTDGSGTKGWFVLPESGGTGDMLKATYDADGDGTVDAAEAVPWAGVTSKPSTFPPSSHTHTASELSDSGAIGRSLIAAASESEARSVLQLGGAATLSVGTSAGTVAAGDDSRFLSSAQKSDLTDGGDSTAHFHAADRARANHTGTQDIVSTTTGTLPVSRGGTGLTSFTAGTLLVTIASDTITGLANGTAGQILRASGGTSPPSWFTPSPLVTNTPPGGTDEFLRADGTWAIPPGSGGFDDSLDRIITGNWTFTGAVTNTGPFYVESLIPAQPISEAYIDSNIARVADVASAYEPALGTGTDGQVLKMVGGVKTWSTDSSTFSWDIDVTHTTTDNSQTVIWSNSIPAGVTRWITADVVAAGPTNFAGYKLTALVHSKASGLVDALIPQAISTEESDADMDAVFAFMGSDHVSLKVTGHANEEIKWVVKGLAFSSANGTASGGPAPPSYLINQGFEGAGYDNSESWFTTFGSPNPDYTAAPLVGSQSLAIETTATTGQVYAPLGDSVSQVYLYFKVRPDIIDGATRPLVYLRDGITGTRLQIDVNPLGQFVVRHGTASATTTAAMAEGAGITYEVWAYYAAGAGSDGIAMLAFSSDGTKPTNGDNFASLTTGTETGAVNRLYFGSASANTALYIIDSVKVDDVEIPASPE